MSEGPAPLSCSRCRARPRVPKQRWCAPCHAAYKRARRALRRETGRETAGTAAANGTGMSVPQQPAGVLPAARSVSKNPPSPVAPDPPAPYTPFKGLAPKPRPAWCEPYLWELAERGLPSLAAAGARIHPRVVRRYQAQDAEFDAEVDVAMDYYRDHLEWESVTLGRVRHNPLPYFARLKAERPGRYLDRAAVLVAAPPELTPADGKALLAAMFGLAPSSAAPPALPAPPAPPEEPAQP